MNKTFKIYAVIFIIVMIILALLEVNKKTVNWRKNFDIHEKSPFGLFVFNNEAKNLFKNNLKRMEQAPYEYYSRNQKDPHNIMVIENELMQHPGKKFWNRFQKDLMQC